MQIRQQDYQEVFDIFIEISTGCAVATVLGSIIMKMLRSEKWRTGSVLQQARSELRQIWGANLANATST